MAFKTKNNTSFADIISFCNDAKSERGNSPITNKSDALMETLSLRSKSPSTFSGDNNAWISPVQKEAIELSTRKRNAVLNMIEKNWKINLRSKIETDLSNQVQQALAPLTSLRKRADKKKPDRQKNLQIYKFNGYNRNRFSSQYNSQNNGATGNFKYIDVNYIPPNKFFSGRSDGFYAKDGFAKSLSNLRLPRRHESVSQSMFQPDEMSRAQKHANNIRGGLDVTLLDSHSSVNFLSLPKHDDSVLRPLIPNAINYNGISLPNYGASRRCFQTYTKEGMNNLLNSRTRRGKLTHLGDGKFVDKRGVIISRLGPFWPQGYGPVCQCPEFITDCPEYESLVSSSGEQKSENNADNSKSLFAGGLASFQPPQAHKSVPKPNQNSNLISRRPSAIVNSPNGNTASTLTASSSTLLKDDLHKIEENQAHLNHSEEIVVDKEQLTSNNTNNNNNITSNSNQSSLKPVNQLSPRDGVLKPPYNQLNKRPPVNGEKPQWKGKPVLYDCDRSSRNPLPHSVPDGLDESLVFESRFESGNLRQVRRIGEVEYELVLRTDMYTNRHTQWYYFRLQKAKQGRTYKFNIINFLKKDSLYNYGMKPLVYSEKLAANYKLGWHRIGEKISYAPWTNPTRNAILSLDLQYYCLEFEVTFDWDEIEEDTVYLAHCYPYTYSDLRRHMDHIMSNPEFSQHVKKEVLCETTAGNACFLLTITEFPDSAKDKYKDFHQEKQGVVITARVHPGETQASWMMKGVIEHLISDDPVAKELRKHFVFKIVPMLNPDGVIVGNYRTSLAARDLNRNYRHPRQELFPTIWHTKQMVDQFNKDHPIILYCDLHGHSRKHMVFMYGCERKAYYQPPKSKKQNGEKLVEKQPTEKSTDPLNETRDFVEERMFPWLMHKLAPNSFSFHGTKFAVRRSKESTGRVVMFRQMKIWNSFTMEASFSGTRMDKGSGRHFNIDDFQLIGRKLCDCVLEYSKICENPVAKSRAIMEMTRSIAQQLLQNTKFINATTEEVPVDTKSNNTENNQVIKQPQQTRPKPAKNVNDSLPNFSHIKSTIAKQVRRNKPISKPDPSRMNSDKRDVTITSLQDENDEIADKGDASVIQSAKSSGNMANGRSLERNDTTSNETDENTDLDNLDINCFKLLQSLNIHQIDIESETSSESNSDSEPELPATNGSSSAKMRSQHNSNGGKKKKKRKRQQKYGKSISAPSKIQTVPSSTHKRLNEDLQSKENKAKATVPTYPGYVNKYAKRSNGGIPIFAQERMEERAARRLAELKLAEKDRRIQENQLREQLLLAGIQDGPSISYDMSMSKKLSDENPGGYSDVCGVRYKVANHAQKVQYVVSNPYRGQSPNAAREHRPVVSMRFSPLSQPQLQHNGDTFEKSQTNGSSNLYMPYRVQAPGGRLSNQRPLNNGLSEFLGSSSDSNPTDPCSSRSSDTLEQHVVDDLELRASSSPVTSQKHMEPRSVVVPVQKYNVSFNIHRKSWKQKTNETMETIRSHEAEDLEFPLHQEHSDSNNIARSNASELILPPNMDAAEVMSAHMRYPAQVHRVEAMRPLPRGRTISRGPPMVFGEPAPFNLKAQEMSATEQSSDTAQRFNKSSLLAKSNSFSTKNQNDSYYLPSEKSLRETFLKTTNTNSTTNMKQNGSTVNSQSLFVPRFVALAPQRVSNGDTDSHEEGHLTDRTSDEAAQKDSNQLPFTVR